MTLSGLVAATYTPFHPDGSLNPDLIAPMFEFMLGSGVTGFYVCGSTGEGPSLTTAERKRVAESSVKAAAQRAPVVVQVGSNCLRDACDLAAHAAQVGADATSAVPPLYFKPKDAAALVDTVSEIAAAAPQLPFYYYHIPRLSGVAIDMVQFLTQAQDRIPNLAGIKFSDPDLSEFRLCQDFANGRFDILFGCDEMALAALAMGAKGFVGSSYGFAAPLWNRIIAAYEKGDTAQALTHQTEATRLIRFLNTTPGPYPATVKQIVWPELGFEVGPLRKPQTTLSESQVTQAKAAFQSSEFKTLVP